MGETAQTGGETGEAMGGEGPSAVDPLGEGEGKPDGEEGGMGTNEEGLMADAKGRGKGQGEERQSMPFVRNVLTVERSPAGALEGVPASNRAAPQEEGVFSQGSEGTNGVGGGSARKPTLAETAQYQHGLLQMEGD